MRNDDACCYLCKSATGICLTRFQCEHHKAVRRRDNATGRTTTYPDPTGNEAVSRVMREQRRKRRKE